MKTKACAYLRMSTDEQDTSIAIQHKRLLELAEQCNYEIVQWYKDEGLSGSREVEKRVDWQKMLADAATAEWEVILCYNRSRFSRLDSTEEGAARQTLRESRKRLHTAIEGPVDWETSTGRLMDAIQTEQNNDYSIKVSAATLEGKLNAFLRGQHYGQKCSYAMARRLVDPKGNVHEITRWEKFKKPKGWEQTFIPGDPQEVETVVWLFTEFNAKDVGYRWLALQLNEKGIRAPEGGKWCAEIVRRALMNPVYAGDTVLGTKLSGKFFRLEGDKVVRQRYASKVTQGKALVRRNSHQAIVDRQLFDSVQEKIRRRTMQIRSLARGEGGYALKGVLFCGNCGGRLYGQRNGGRKKSGIITYVCKNAVRFGETSGCSQWKIKEKEILPSVIGRLTDAIDLRLLEANSVQPPKDDAPSPEDDVKAKVSALERKLTALDAKISLGAERFLSAPIQHTAELDAKLTEWKMQRALLVEEIERARKVRPKLEERLREWQEWFSAAKQQLIHAQSSPPYGARFEEGLRFTPERFRETLRRFGCRVLIWWKRRSARRWDVDRFRIQLGVEYEPEPRGGCKKKTVTGRVKELERQAAEAESNAAPSETNRSFSFRVPWKRRSR